MNGAGVFCIESSEVKKVNLRQRLSAYAAAIGMLILILDGKTALTGAQEGIRLCLETVIPALFPFFLLSTVLIRCGTPEKSGKPGWIGRLFGLPAGAEYLLIPGFLGGYPVGAQCVAQAYRNGSLSKPDALRLLAFCNNAGPAFLFGMVGQFFPNRWMVWLLWLIHISGALIAASCFTRNHSFSAYKATAGGQETSPLLISVKTMGIVCGWIVLFRVVIAFGDRWILWLFPPAVRVALVALLELSNGCCELSSVADIPMRFLLCSGVLAAGGLCVTMQTASVTDGLSLKYYFTGKLIQLCVSLILSTCIAYSTLLPLVLLLPFAVLWKGKKGGSNPSLSGV